MGETPVEDAAIRRPTAVEASAAPEAGSPTQSATRAGALIAGASLLATALNYVFLLIAGRLLGSADYGALAALLGLLTFVLLPTGALQLAVSREVSRSVALGDEKGASAFARAVLRLGAIVTVPIVVVAVVLVVPVRELLGVDSTVVVAVAMTGVVIALVFPITLGVLQGYQRFQALAAMYLFPFVARLALLVAAAVLGFALGGAVFAAVAAGVLSTFAAIWLVRAPLRRGAGVARPALAPFLRYLWPVVIGLVGIAVLTNVDILAVKARFSAEEAGQYAAAAAFAKIAFFLPATILAVLFPRTAARQARGEETADILGRSLLVTALFGALLSCFYAMTGRGLVHTSFGAEFAEGGELLVLLTLSMTIFAIANVAMGFHLSRGETRYAWLVAAAVPVQIVVLSLVPESPRQVIWANIALGVALLVAHELVAGSSLPALRDGGRQLVGEMRLPRRALGEGVLVLLGMTAFVAVLFWPMVSDIGSTVIAFGSDAVGGVWAFWRWHEEGGYHVFGTTHHALTSAPFGWDEGNGLNLQWLLPYYPGYLLTGVVGEVAAYNTVLLAGYVLSGASMYLLVRYLGCTPSVAAWGGVVYVVFPWHLMRTPHASLTHLQLLPLLVLVLVAFFRRPDWARLALVGGVVFGCWLTSGYFGTMALLTTAMFALAAVLTSRREAVRPALGTVAAAIAASLIVVALGLLSGVGRDVGREPAVGDLATYGVRGLELVVPGDRNLVVGDALESFWSGRTHGSNDTERNTYLGLLTVALALSWLVVLWRRRRSIPERLRVASLGLLLTALVSLALAAPSPVRLFGVELVMPSRLLFEVVPAFRVPSRWIPLVMTALVPLAALGLQSILRLARNAGGGRVATGTIVASAMAISFLELAVWPAQPLVRATPVPPEYQALERAPEGILAEYPLVEEIDRQFWQREHGRPTVNPLAFGTPVDEARRVLLHPDVPGTAEALALLGVSAIITHGEAFDYGSGVRYEPRTSWGPGYALIARTPDGTSVWRIAAPAASALVTFEGGFGDPVPTGEGHAGYPLVQPAGVATLGIIAKAPSVSRISFDVSAPGDEPRQVRIADNAGEIAFVVHGTSHVTVPVEIPRGRSYLLLKTEPPATSAADALVVSAPRAVATSDEPGLRAVRISADPGY